MTREEIQRVVLLDKKATKGPWKYQRRTIPKHQERAFEIWTDEGISNDRPIAFVDGDNAVWLEDGEDEGNAAFIAASRTAMPEMTRMLLDIHKACDIYEKNKTVESSEWEAEIYRILGRTT